MSEKLKSFVEIYGTQKDAKNKDNWNLLFGVFCLGWDADKWIYVKDGLPAENNYYQVSDVEGQVWICEFMGGKFTPYFSDPTPEIIAWQPLPRPAITQQENYERETKKLR